MNKNDDQKKKNALPNKLFTKFILKNVILTKAILISCQIEFTATTRHTQRNLCIYHDKFPIL